MAKITKLRLVKDKPVATVVDELKMLLAKARRGEIRSIAWAAGTSDGMFSTSWAHDPDGSFALVAGVARLEYRLQLESASEVETECRDDE